MSVERLDPEEAPEASVQEHLARYRFARGLVSGRLLDVACGNGYGTALLGAVGVDLSWAALRRACSETSRLIRCNALRLPFGQVFDGVVSFETVEHVSEPERFVEECARVLRPGGRLVISTPNRELWSPHSPRPVQKHHVREFSRKEFERLLAGFKRVDYFGQRLMDRRAAAAFELRELTKRVLRALVPVKRFQPASGRPWRELTPDPAWEVRPLGTSTAAVFVAVATS